MVSMNKKIVIGSRVKVIDGPLWPMEATVTWVSTGGRCITVMGPDSRPVTLTQDLVEVVNVDPLLSVTSPWGL